MANQIFNTDAAGNDVVALGGILPQPMDPTRYLDDSLKTSIDATTQRYQQQWAGIRKQARRGAMPTNKANELAMQLKMQRDQEIGQLRMKAQERAGILERIGKLQEQGLLAGANAERALWETAGGKDLADSMFPGPVKQQDALTEYGKLSTLERDTTTAIDKGYEVEPYDASWIPFHGGGGQKLNVFNPATGEWDKVGTRTVRNGVTTITSGGEHWQELKTQQELIGTVRQAKQALRESPLMSNRLRKASAQLVTGEKPGGTLSDKVGAGVVLRQSQPAPRRKKLDRDTAAAFMEQADGDKQQARQLAQQAGYSF